MDEGRGLPGRRKLAFCGAREDLSRILSPSSMEKTDAVGIRNATRFWRIRRRSTQRRHCNASHVDAALIHEAAIGKIAGEQILKLKTLGLTDEQAEEKIIQGFLK